MKKYFFIVPSIIDMGGAQMYTRNKLVDMQHKGWSVDLISAQRGKVYIPELRKYDAFIPELGFDYYLFSKKKRDAIVKGIVTRILDADYEEIVIESTCISESTWAEVIAEQCNARHLSYLLQEDNLTSSRTDQEFFKFKLQRNELASITEQSIHDMFASFAPVTPDQSEKCFLPAYCNNVVEDIDSEWLDEIRSIEHDYLVGCLSRLDKPFIVPALKSFINYVGTHPNKQFLLVMMGGAPEGSGFEKNIRKMFKNVRNVSLLVTGYLFPVSTRLLASFDAFFSSAGSCWVCMRSGIPTISIDGNDFLPIGVLGHTTNHSLFRDDKELPLNFNSIMDEILIKHSFERQEAHHELNKPNFASHDEFLQKMAQGKSYFSFCNVLLSGSEKTLARMLALVGPANYMRLSVMKSNLRKLLAKK